MKIWTEKGAGGLDNIFKSSIAENNFTRVLNEKMERHTQADKPRDSYIKMSQIPYMNYSDCIKYKESENTEADNYETEDEKSETEADIVVKPDGSRVMMLTTKIGNLVSVVSLEISKPTDLQNKSTEVKEDNMTVAEIDETCTEMQV